MELTKQDKLRLIEFFEFQRDIEASKPLDEMDLGLIDNYVKILLHLQDKHVELSPEFIDEQVRKIFHPEETAAPETAKTTKKVFNQKKVWLIAACIAILVALFSIISLANDWNIFDELKNKFGSVFSAPIEEVQDVNGVSIKYHGKNTIYSSIEEALKAEKFNVLYPTVLPDGIKITDITCYKDNSEYTIMYGFNSSEIYSKIYFNKTLTETTKGYATEVCEINSITCYICEMPDIPSTQIEFEYKGNTYFFSHTDKHTLIKIIENLKEINHEN